VNTHVLQPPVQPRRGALLTVWGQSLVTLGCQRSCWAICDHMDGPGVCTSKRITHGEDAGRAVDLWAAPALSQGGRASSSDARTSRELRSRWLPQALSPDVDRDAASLPAAPNGRS
jgi:hypothetical protein